MAELYSVVGKAIGRGVKAEDFSPNNIKALVINEGYVLCIRHVNSPKIYPVDEMKAIEEIKKGTGSSGNLNNLFEGERVLSCLEEIYVSPFINENKQFFDLERFANQVSSVSRLRRIGVCSVDYQLARRNEFIQALNEFFINKWSYDVLISDLFNSTWGEGLVKYVEIDNPDWYRKYNLRPNIYKKDADKGQLAQWFKKAEKSIMEGESSRIFRLDCEIANNFMDKVKNVMGTDCVKMALARMKSRCAKIGVPPYLIGDGGNPFKSLATDGKVLSVEEYNNQLKSGELTLIPVVWQYCQAVIGSLPRDLKLAWMLIGGNEFKVGPDVGSLNKNEWFMFLKLFEMVLYSLPVKVRENLWKKVN